MMSENNSPGGREELPLIAVDGKQETPFLPPSIDNTQKEPSLETIGSEEDVDRSIRSAKDHLALQGGGNVYVTANAFADKNKQPSFYRRCLTDDPPYSDPPRLFSPDKEFPDAVVTLRADAIRQINPFAAESGEGKNKEATRYLIDIQPDLTENQHKAHAIVHATPHYKSNKAFQMIKEKLARIANDRIAAEGWPIAPDPDFVKRELRG